MTPADPPTAGHRVRRVLRRPARLSGSGLLALLLCVLSVAVAMPAGAAPVTVTARDGFSRIVSGGWGTADQGGAWTVLTPSRFAATGGMGTIALTTDGRTQQAHLPQTGTSNDVTITLAASRTPTGGGLFVSVSGRRIADVGQYQAKVRWLADGTVAVSLVRLDTRWAETVLVREATVPGVRGVTGQQVKVRVQVTGTSPTAVRAKVWQATAAEPAAWTAGATDNTARWQVTGGVGLHAYLSRSSVPLTVRVDDVAASLTSDGTVAPPPPPPPPLPRGRRDPARSSRRRR
ncbi:hypothetical protein [Blastococcus sp. PRF04-17]|uniref:hypothetical protein n=1 Tax=Blastococcus sp. PRF04-17 TaxID=2933797 RepID=UPI001FF222AB|nr:hypothetical protein [Blastococcus sp. PRF04-17]UOY00742.1 hypothetical protein MVA48_17395 [Blastococcus sp. PRF04-17]